MFKPPKGLPFGGLNITAIAKCESDKKKSYATKTTNLPLFKGKSATHANLFVFFRISFL